MDNVHSSKKKEIDCLKKQIKFERQFCEICKKDNGEYCRSLNRVKNLYVPENYFLVCEKCHYKWFKAERDLSNRCNELVKEFEEKLYPAMKSFVKDLAVAQVTAVLSVTENNDVVRRADLDSFFSGKLLYERMPEVKFIVDFCRKYGVNIDSENIKRVYYTLKNKEGSD